MGTLRVSLVGTVMLMLVSGTASIAAAQDDVDQGAVDTAVVVKDTAVWWEDYGDKVENDPEGDPVHWYGAIARSKWVADDPRLSGDATYREMMHRYQEEGLTTLRAEYTIVNDEGSWVGTNSGFDIKDGDYGVDVVELDGEGAYEGLAAFLVATDWHNDREFVGVIVSGGMPPLPEPAE